MDATYREHGHGGPVPSNSAILGSTARWVATAAKFSRRDQIVVGGQERARSEPQGDRGEYGYRDRDDGHRPDGDAATADWHVTRLSLTRPGKAAARHGRAERATARRPGRAGCLRREPGDDARRVFADWLADRPDQSISAVIQRTSAPFSWPGRPGMGTAWPARSSDREMRQPERGSGPQSCAGLPSRC